MATGARSDYGHLYSFLKAIAADKDLELAIIATGMHLAKDHGLTYREIIKDGFKIKAFVPILLFSNSKKGVVQSIAEACKGFSKALSNLKPDMLVILGDRFEMLGAAIAAYILRIPIVHIHGGETTEGVIDEGIRHAITKMATVHFPATEVYRKRIIQMGEDPSRVFNFGAPGLDILKEMEFLSREEIAQKINFDLSGKVAIVTFHPVVDDGKLLLTYVDHLCKALDSFKIKVVFTQSNADAQGNLINQYLKNFVKKDPGKYKFYPSLGFKMYMSCLKHFDVVVGNSSSGFIEAPSLGIPVVNIGDRQKGRVRSQNIIDTGYDLNSIKRAISKALIPKKRKFINPYQKYRDGKTGYRIKEKIKTFRFGENVLKKSFYDVDFK